MIVEIEGKHYRLRYRDNGFPHPEDKGLWRAYMIDRSTITGDWFPCDDDDYMITDDLQIVAREIGWDLRRVKL